MSPLAPRPLPVAAAPRPRSARDFFSELMTDSQSTSAASLAERDRWLRSVKVEGREELLFEFEMLLRGVERFFNLHNLPIDESQPVVTRDFREELADVRDAIEQAIRIARQLLDPDADQKMIFRKYVESRLVDHRARRLLIEDELDQDTPQESLFILREGFDALRTVIDHLLELPSCPYALFSDVGTIALRDVVLNRYFRPFRPLEFRIEYDRIRSVPILEALAGQAEPDRTLLTVAFLALFRLLHYLSYVGGREEAAPPRRVRVILALARSESLTLVGFLRSELAVRATRKRYQGAALRLARDIGRESDRINRKLVEELGGDDASLADAAVQLTELFRRQIGALATAIDYSLEGDGLFRRLVSRADMASRLRRDLWVFAELCREAAEAFRRPEPGPPEAALSALKRYLAFFQDVSYQLLRYGEFEAFDRFTELLMEVERPPEGPLARERLADDCRRFATVAEGLFFAVNRRGELVQKPFEADEARRLLERFRPGA